MPESITGIRYKVGALEYAVQQLPELRFLEYEDEGVHIILRDLCVCVCVVR